MVKLKEISRFKAAAIHLLISTVIALGSLAAMLALWYPPPYFLAMGGIELILLIVGVDVAIGPLITLIVFDTQKKSLPFDLLVVAVLQLAALIYGVYAMQAGRPVFTVFTGRALVVVTAAEIEPEALSQGRSEEFRHLSLTGPRLVAAEQPSDPDELTKLAFAGLGGLGIQHLPRYYVPYDEQKADLLKATRTFNDIQQAGADYETKVRRYLERTGKNLDSLRYLPVKTHQGILLGIIDAGNGDLLDIL